MGGASTGPRGNEVLESRNQRARRIGAAVLRNRSGADVARCAATGPCNDRRVGWCPCRSELQREPKRDGHNPRRASTPALSDPSGRIAERDTDRCECSNLRSQSPSPGLGGSDSTPAQGRIPTFAETDCVSRARAHPRSPSQRATADQPTTGDGRKQADSSGLQRREPHELEPDSFPRAHVRRTRTLPNRNG